MTNHNIIEVFVSPELEKTLVMVRDYGEKLHAVDGDPSKIEGVNEELLMASFEVLSILDDKSQNAEYVSNIERFIGGDKNVILRAGVLVTDSNDEL